jgi:hypothetical protein
MKKQTILTSQLEGTLIESANGIASRLNGAKKIPRKHQPGS